MVMVVAGRAIFVVSTMRIQWSAVGVRIFLAARPDGVGAASEKDHIGSEAVGI